MDAAAFQTSDVDSKIKNRGVELDTGSTTLIVCVSLLPFLVANFYQLPKLCVMGHESWECYQFEYSAAPYMYVTQEQCTIFGKGE